MVGKTRKGGWNPVTWYKNRQTRKRHNNAVKKEKNIVKYETNMEKQIKNAKKLRNENLTTYLTENTECHTKFKEVFDECRKLKVLQTNFNKFLCNGECTYKNEDDIKNLANTVMCPFISTLGYKNMETYNLLTKNLIDEKDDIYKACTINIDYILNKENLYTYNDINRYCDVIYVPTNTQIPTNTQKNYSPKKYEIQYSILKTLKKYNSIISTLYRKINTRFRYYIELYTYDYHRYLDEHPEYTVTYNNVHEDYNFISLYISKYRERKKEEKERLEQITKKEREEKERKEKEREEKEKEKREEENRKKIETEKEKKEEIEKYKKNMETLKTERNSKVRELLQDNKYKIKGTTKNIINQLKKTRKNVLLKIKKEKNKTSNAQKTIESIKKDIQYLKDPKDSKIGINYFNTLGNKRKYFNKLTNEEKKINIAHLNRILEQRKNEMGKNNFNTMSEKDIIKYLGNQHITDEEKDNIELLKQIYNIQSNILRSYKGKRKGDDKSGIYYPKIYKKHSYYGSFGDFGKAFTNLDMSYDDVLAKIEETKKINAAKAAKAVEDAKYPNTTSFNWWKE